MVYLFVVQVTVTLVTFALATVPEPFVTTQVCDGDVGFVRTVTAYVAPLAIGVANEKVPFAETVRLSPPLS